MAIDCSIEKLRADFHAKICEAFSRGMSVIELTNLFGYLSINFVHSLLMDAKLILPMPRTGKRQSYDIDPRLQQALDKRGYSFARWCAGRGLDPNDVAAALRKTPSEGISSAHDAVRRDLPETYLEIFEGRPPLEKSQEKKNYPRLSLNILWDEFRLKYVASVPETPGVEAIGYNWETALHNMVEVQRLQRHIGLLRDCLEKRYVSGHII
jgi:hypothetical protein